MYETIMNLPLFKGVSREQVSLFLEKTHLHFYKYMDGEAIVSPNDLVKGLKCIMGGNAVVKHFLPAESLEIHEILGKENVLGADRLYGLNTRYRNEVSALGETSIMEFSKEQYQELLKRNPIYMINFLNYLSSRAQRPAMVFNALTPDSMLGKCAMYVSLLTDRAAGRIIIRSALGMTLKERLETKGNAQIIETLIESGILSFDGNDFTIFSRNEFLDAVAQGN